MEDNVDIWAALLNGDLNAVKQYVAGNGSKINTMFNDKGECLLHVAIQCKDLELITYLLNEPQYILHDHTSQSGETPFILACKSNQLEAVKLLATKPIDINKAEHLNGFTGLHYAVNEGYEDLMQYLVLYPGIELEVKDKKYRTLFISACMHGHIQTVKLLVYSKGVDLNAVDDAGHMGLHYAIMNGHSELVEFLVSLPGLQLEYTGDKSGRTPFLLICQAKMTASAKQMVKKKVDTNAQDKDDNTALHFAVLNYISASTNDEDRIELVKYLTSNELVIKYRKNIYGQTPKDLAEERGLNQLVELFEKYERKVQEVRTDDKLNLMNFAESLLYELQEIQISDSHNQRMTRNIKKLQEDIHKSLELMNLLKRVKMTESISQSSKLYIRYSIFDVTQLQGNELCDKIILYLSKELGHTWKTLAGFLQVDQQMVNHWLMHFPKENLFCSWSMLISWRNTHRMSPSAQRKQLRHALAMLGKVNLVDLV